MEGNVTYDKMVPTEKEQKERKRMRK